MLYYQVDYTLGQETDLTLLEHLTGVQIDDGMVRVGALILLPASEPCVCW